jgi:hypothetical protein
VSPWTFKILIGRAAPKDNSMEMVIGVERVRKLLAIDPTCDRFRDYARVKWYEMD